MIASLTMPINNNLKSHSTFNFVLLRKELLHTHNLAMLQMGQLTLLRYIDSPVSAVTLSTYCVCCRVFSFLAVLFFFLHSHLLRTLFLLITLSSFSIFLHLHLSVLLSTNSSHALRIFTNKL